MLLVGFAAREAGVAEVEGSLKNEEAVSLSKQETLSTHFEPELELVSEVRCRLLGDVDRSKSAEESSMSCRH